MKDKSFLLNQKFLVKLPSHKYSRIDFSPNKNIYRDKTAIFKSSDNFQNQDPYDMMVVHRVVRILMRDKI